MKKAAFAILGVALVVSAFALAQRAAPQLRLELVDHSGKRTELGGLPISTFAPRISPDGREIYFNRDDRLFSVAVKVGSTITAATPVQLPINGLIQDVGRRQFDITPDGKQFLMLFPPRN
jgi:hypothetical protein